MIKFLIITNLLVLPLVSCGRTTSFTTNSIEEPQIGVKLLQNYEGWSDLWVDQQVSANNMTPVLFWHGMGDTAFGSVNVPRLALLKTFPGIKVFSVQVGSNALEDMLAGYFVNVNHQVEQVCQEILNNEAIKEHGSLNCVGFSQGAQFLRAVIQRCPLEEAGIRVKNFISLGGQMQGVYGLPNCFQKQFCDHIRFLLTEGAYDSDVQEHLVQAEYWHDPLREDLYQKKSIFLAEINRYNETYKSNILKLDSMTLVGFQADKMVRPRESSLFAYYKPGSTSEIEPLRESALYQEDWLGLRELDESGRLHFIELPGDHLQFNMVWWKEIALKYLNN